MRALILTAMIGTTFGLSACGGSGGGSGSTTDPVQPPPQTATGRFIDSEVEGLSFESGDQSGITSASGSFTYEVGQPVSFSVGSVLLGTVTGDSVITPVELVDADTSNLTVQNIVRFLLMLDSDGDSSNGITLSNAVQLAAENWAQVDFATTDLATALTSIMADVAMVDNRTPVLPNTTQAQSHVEGTLSCLASGVYAGTFSGDDNGAFLLWVQHQRFDPLVFGDNTPRIGVTSALVFSTDDNLVSGVAPQQGLAFDSDRQFLSGVVSTGAEFSGELASYQSITNGSWVNGLANESGAFNGERIAGDGSAVHRLSGFFNLQGQLFSVDGSGVLALDIFDDDSVTGTMVTLRGNQSVLAGSLNGNQITMTGGNNSFSLTFDADGTDTSNDALLGTTAGFVGQWNGTNGLGDVIGTSCQP